MENEKLIVFEEAERAYNIRHRCFHFAKDVIHFLIFDQLLRSSTSIGVNVVEEGSGSTKKDFINFFHISLKSSNETKYWLCLIRDTIKVNKNKLEELLKEADALSKIIGTIILKAK